ncbi:MAG: peptidoglycan-binding protein [Synechococcales cyanobacterium C42_A2020_086]|jgi:hypothetical protein|nr:peptidoglycan-binding protein [Synechococcales cyanobacterium C42_A2020_086]
MNGHPHGAWIWVLSNIQADYLNKLVEQHVKRVYLKVFDGKSRPMFWDFQCSPDVIKQFKSRGIEVYGWGYHYGTADVKTQTSAVQQALNCGLDGYILDVEVEVENKATHPNVEELLKALKPVVPTGALGYTSFGHPGFHPNVPWKILDTYCDLAFPQIYFEKFRFGATNADEVQACIKAHKDLGLKKLLLPIWGSESDAANPASAGELQFFLNSFPGSSIWRIPNAGERGEAWKLNYIGTPVQLTGSNVAEIKLPVLIRILKKGSFGEDVEALQSALNALGYNAGDIDGDFGTNTEKAVRRLQQKAGLTIDGEVGSETWKVLGGEANINRQTQGILARLADFAEAEAQKALTWTNSSSEAEKYLDIFRKPMQNLGQIGSAKVFYDWCGAFAFYCCQQVGIEVPIQPDGFWATMALVESWKYWAKKQGTWYAKGNTTPKRGDIVVFDWDSDGELNHIGIVRGYTPGSNLIRTSEGNRGNRSGNFERSMDNVAGIIRLSS